MGISALPGQDAWDEERTAGPVEEDGADGLIEPGEIEVGFGALSPLWEDFVKDCGWLRWQLFLLLILGVDELCGDARDSRGERGAADGRGGEHARAEWERAGKGGKERAGEETGAGDEEHRWVSTWASEREESNYLFVHLFARWPAALPRAWDRSHKIYLL